MGLLNKSSSPISEFRIEYLAGSKNTRFGPGQLLQGIYFNSVPILSIRPSNPRTSKAT